MTDRAILVNRIRTPDGIVLTSRHVHDYRTHVDKSSGDEYMVDGGMEYLRRSIGQTVPYEELSLFEDDPHEDIREEFEWGTYGPTGTDDLRYVRLCDMSDDHIEAVLETQNLRQCVRDLFNFELAYRRKYANPRAVNFSGD